MPVVSDAQRRAMYAAQEGHSNLGIPQKVGAEFIAASHGITGLPKRKKQAGAAVSRAQQAFFGFLKSHPDQAAQRGFGPQTVSNFARGPGGTIQGLPQHAGNMPTPPRLRSFGQLAP